MVVVELHRAKDLKMENFLLGVAAPYVQAQLLTQVTVQASPQWGARHCSQPALGGGSDQHCSCNPRWDETLDNKQAFLCRSDGIKAGDTLRLTIWCSDEFGTGETPIGCCDILLCDIDCMVRVCGVRHVVWCRVVSCRCLVLSCLALPCVALPCVALAWSRPLPLGRPCLPCLPFLCTHRPLRPSQIGMRTWHRIDSGGKIQCTIHLQLPTFF